MVATATADPYRDELASYEASLAGMDASQVGREITALERDLARPEWQLTARGTTKQLVQAKLRLARDRRAALTAHTSQAGSGKGGSGDASQPAPTQLDPNDVEFFVEHYRRQRRSRGELEQIRTQLQASDPSSSRDARVSAINQIIGG